MDFAPEQTPGNPDPADTAGTSASSASDTTFEQPTPAPAGPAGPPREERLHRVTRGRMLGGVAAGAADYFDVDPTVVRIGFVVLAFLGGLAVPLYIAGWLLIPDEDTDTSVAEELLARQQTHGAY